MNLGITIIGVIGVACCTLPFILTNISRNKKGKEILKVLKNVAEKHQAKITKHEICGAYAIGIDESKKAVSFVSKNKEEIVSQYVDLSTIKSCEISRVNRISANKGEVIDCLSLKLSSDVKQEPDIFLEFYNAKVNYQFSGEIQSIEKWNQLIHDLLN
ncbi:MULTISPECIES: hypothetical protein [Winogradskyella]|uniref:hypothetical protein n=1 Tax=Winogradskyella TaxID=286104 RepID=UPI0015C9265E|nr:MULTISPECIES: hypothetical protein [Winogradskyella]QXP78172.1 hypothetical protein H0I32_13210 [Winogradskyella sp. HaHa_3_26]